MRASVRHLEPPRDDSRSPLRRFAVGVDVVAVDRVAGLVDRRGEALTARVFTAAELRGCHGDTRRLAARLAAKEAVAKALGTGIGPIGWRDVEVPVVSGPPTVRLHGAARAAARHQGLERWGLSLAHDSTHAVAVVVAAGTGDPS
ncbi:holo-ACP synthase [Actinotalea sp. M2MS4P-6]|uniref:holo-ACP synthase n=1 Tax=Actinotalea sp. M2MS4P-6 TaxID=2983762 RepID=UPI0021E46464|nr:holo-ACP synthase [Actinotalea sp. M2MS4P-6]MCV2394240.1 holo-ACP synthase [Actinotalea sp. M2MS4P-6]